MFGHRYRGVRYWGPHYWGPKAVAGAGAAGPPPVQGAPGLPAAFWRRRPRRATPPNLPLVVLRPLPPLDLWDDTEVLWLLALLTGDSVHH